jgi:serine O-acetyltransferase
MEDKLKGGLHSSYAVFVHRLGQSVDSPSFKGVKRIFGIFCRLSYQICRYLCVVLCKIYIDERTTLGQNVKFSSRGNIILGARIVGDSCVVHHDVTLGMRIGHKGLSGIPAVAEKVWIGPDSLIYGGINIGEGATILGGAVVTKNLPARCVAGGNPGRIVMRDFDNSLLLVSPRSDFTSQELEELVKDND